MTCSAGVHGSQFRLPPSFRETLEANLNLPPSSPLGGAVATSSIRAWIGPTNDLKVCEQAPRSSSEVRLQRRSSYLMMTSSRRQSITFGAQRFGKLNLLTSPAGPLRR